jgi:drug/metabolite transporter (DMT)-like permease
MKLNGFYTAIVGATFCMGTSFIASKILLQTVPPFTLVGWRFFLAAIATLPVIFLLKQRFSGVFTQDWRKIAIVGLLQTAGTMGLLFLSMLYISASMAAVLLFTNPLWVALLSPIILKEKIRTPQYIGLFLGFLGVVLLIGFNANALEIRGNLLALSSALCWASATLFAKYNQLKVPPFILSFGQMLVGGILLIILSFFGNETYNLMSATPKDWFWFAWLVLPSSVGSFGLWYVALSRGGAVKASSFLFLAPLFTVITSVLILKTSVRGQQLIGAILVGFALYIVNRVADYYRVSI